MVTKTILVAIKFGCCLKWKPKRGNITNLVLLVSITQKDGQFKKIWSPSNHHNFSDGEQRFLVTKKEGMPPCF